MLLRLYYLYEKSAKKVRQLKEVVEDLKEVYDYSEGGCIPVRSQGSRIKEEHYKKLWINMEHISHI